MDEIAELFNAVGNGDVTRVRTLVQDRPDLARARNASTLSVLQFARYAGTQGMLELLLDAGPPPDIFEAAMIDRADLIREISARDASAVRAYSSDGFTALHFAAFFGSTNAITALLDAGADIEARTTNFLANMPIHAAAAGGHLDACKLLIERGADVNARQHGGFPPLHSAAFHDSRPMAELFFSEGADPRAADEEGKTAADRAAMQGNMELAALLQAKEAASA